MDNQIDWAIKMFEAARQKAISQFPHLQYLIKNDTDTYRLMMWMYAEGGMNGVQAFHDKMTEGERKIALQKANLQ